MFSWCMSIRLTSYESGPEILYVVGLQNHDTKFAG